MSTPPPVEATASVEQSRFQMYGAKKDARAMIEEAKDPNKSLKKSLGALDLTVLGVGAIIGAGIFALAANAALVAGPNVIWSFVVAGFACALAGLAYAELASTIPTSGSAYAYTYSALGELPAWLLGWALVLEYAVGATTVAISWSGYAQGLVNADAWLPDFLRSGPQAFGGIAGGFINLPAALITLLVAGLLIRGSKESARTTSVLVIVKVAIIIFVIVFGLAFFTASNFSLAAPAAPTTGLFSGFGPMAGIMAAASLIFFAYIGFDAVSTTAEETKNPKRDLPIGILGSLAICTILYILCATVLLGMVPYTDFLNPETRAEPFAYAFREVGQPVVANIVAAGAIAGITSVLFVMLMGGPRVFFALARDGLLPQSWAKVHPKFGSPARTTIGTGIVVAIAAALMPINLANELTSIGTLFAFALVCVNVIVLRYTLKDVERPFQVPLSIGRFPILAVLGALTCLTLIVALATFTHIAFTLWMGIGIMFYALYGIRNSRLRNPEATPAAAGESRAVPVANRGRHGEGDVEVVLEEMR